MSDALTGMLGPTGDESLVTLFECFPRAYRICIGHGRHSCRTSELNVPANELLDWYDRSHRDLPWRQPAVSPWQILVSEFMLQQTPVARVLPIWTEWVRRWPTASATAAASAADVVRAWGKLGYPRRAKRLHECATVIARDHGDVVPDELDALLRLPGVGSYTARAVVCFAYRQPVPVVDTNVRRVVARAVHGCADAAPPSATRDHADVVGAAARRRTGATIFGGADGAGRDGVHGPDTAMRIVPAGRVRMAARRLIPPRPARRGASRPTREPTGRSAGACWMCCATTTLPLLALSWTWRGSAIPPSATERSTRCWTTAW